VSRVISQNVEQACKPSSVGRESALNWRYQIGAFGARGLDAVLSWRYCPLTRYVPSGLSWLYDVQRFIGTRALGIVFDVGANRGQTLQQLLRFAPKAQIYSFEPASETFALLEKSFTGRSNVHLLNLAVGASPDRMALQVGADSELNTLVRRPSCEAASQMVDVTTVDAIVAANGLSHVDLLKIDVQGWEMEVMRGAATLIANHNLLFVFAEVAFRADQKEMQQFAELHSHLESKGFSLCGFYEPLRYGPRKEFVLFANALYLHPQARLKWTDIGPEWEDWLAGEAVRRTAG
jgi:FkbM family methyltransferase